MALDVKKLAKEVVKIVNVVTVTLAALQSSGVLAGISPKADALALGAVAVLNQIVHAIPANLLADAPK